MKTLLAAASAASLFLTTPARAQDAVVPAVTQPEPGVTGCELHVWPTENYVGINTGMLSALGGIGAIIEADANAGKVKTVKGLMRDYLGPEVQMEELSKIGLAETLKLRGYRIVVQEPTPSKEDLKSTLT